MLIIEEIRNVVIAIAIMTKMLRQRFPSSFLCEHVDLSARIIIKHKPASFLLVIISEEFSILYADNAVRKLGNRIIMGNHDHRLMKFHAGKFQK